MGAGGMNQPGRAKAIGIIGFPQDIGASRRGVDMGPYALRAEGLLSAIEALGYVVRDYGNVPCLGIEDVRLRSTSTGPALNCLEAIIHNMGALKQRVQQVLADGAMPVVIGGDHSQAMGTVAGLRETYGTKLGVLWVDAHGDFNTPVTSPSGNIHGMPLAVLCGRGDQRLLDIGPFPGCREENTVLFGVRDLDLGEIELLQASAVQVFSSYYLLKEGFCPSVEKALAAVGQGVDHVHLSFDMDAIDPTFCPGTGTAVPGGLSNREALYLMEQVFASGKTCSIDLVEVNPALDFHNQTAEFAVELLCRALGKRTVF
jgi:arginase